MNFTTTLIYQTDGGEVRLTDKGAFWSMVVTYDGDAYSPSLKRLIILVVKNRIKPIVSDIHDNFDVMLRLAKKLGAEIYEDHSIAFK